MNGGRICGSCAVDNPSTAQFCMACGAKLRRSCPECGAPALPEARFCVACGTALQVDGEAAGPDAGLAAGLNIVHGAVVHPAVAHELGLAIAA